MCVVAAVDARPGHETALLEACERYPGSPDCCQNLPSGIHIKVDRHSVC